MNRLGVSGWDKFREAMWDAHETFHQKAITWRKLKSRLNRYGEDNTGNSYDDKTLLVQLNYNLLRTWPISFRTETGDLDRQSVQILINKRYLSENNYLNGSGLFDYNPAEDLFIIDGLVHTPVGDSPGSQAYEDDILFTIIVKRDEGTTGNIR
jgi:hypothetical protein